MRFLYRTSFYTALFSITLLAFLPDYSALPEVVSYSDLANHAAAFAVLSVLYLLSYRHTSRRIVSTLLAYGIFLEAVQALLPTRFASVEDIIADAVGVVIGLVAVKLVVEGRKKAVPHRGEQES